MIVAQKWFQESAWIELQNRNLKLNIGAHFELSLRHSKALKFHYITMVALVYFDTIPKC